MDHLCADTEYSQEDMKEAMVDRDDCRENQLVRVDHDHSLKEPDGMKKKERGSFTFLQ